MHKSTLLPTDRVLCSRQQSRLRFSSFEVESIRTWFLLSVFLSLYVYAVFRRETEVPAKHHRLCIPLTGAGLVAQVVVTLPTGAKHEHVYTTVVSVYLSMFIDRCI